MRITLLECPIDNLSMVETVEFIDSRIAQKKKTQHVSVNAAKLVKMRKEKELRDAVLNSDIISADGQSVVWASRLLGTPLKERVAGIDLMGNLVELAHRKGYSVFLLGAPADVVKKVAEDYTHEFGKQIVAGYQDGYFSDVEEEKIVKQINRSGADMLFVAMSSPKKEIFLDKYRDAIEIPFVMGVGGAFDVLAGKTKRAPGWMQRNGLEWLYRLLQEPGRMWKRYLVTNFTFIYMVLKEKCLILSKDTKRLVGLY